MEFSNEYSVTEVCQNEWSNKISKYWKYIGKVKPCYVLLGQSDSYILLLNKEFNGEMHQALLFNEPFDLKKNRNYIWHEMGHLKCGKVKDIIENEFLADKWAIEESYSRGFINITKEILIRCKYYIVNGCKSEHYVDASKKILDYYSDLYNDFKLK